MHRALPGSQISPLPSFPSMIVPTLLVVDDDPYLRATLEYTFRAEGFQVLVASDGAEGIAAATSSRPDIILLDLRMPRMDGRSAIAKLRADPLTALIPIIAYTAEEGVLDADLRALGFSAWMPKTSGLPQLTASIWQFLAGDPGGASAVAVP